MPEPPRAPQAAFTAPSPPSSDPMDAPVASVPTWSTTLFTAASEASVTAAGHPASARALKPEAWTHESDVSATIAQILTAMGRIGPGVGAETRCGPAWVATCVSELCRSDTDVGVLAAAQAMHVLPHIHAPHTTCNTRQPLRP